MSGYSEKARVSVFDGKPENFDRWEIQWNAFVEVEGMSGAQEDALNAGMHEDVNVVIPEMVLLTETCKAKDKSNKDNKTCIA
jgi:hypothetical protein